MAKVQRSIDIDAPIEAVWKVITDYDRYPEFLKDTKKVTSKNRSGGSVEVTTELGLMGTSVKYTLRMTETAPTRMSWTLVEGQMMKSNEGGWKLEALGPARTRAQYEIEIGFGLLVPKGVVNALVDSNLPSMLEAFKKRAESQAKTGA